MSRGADAAGGASSDPLPVAPIATLAGQPADLGQVAHGRVALVSFWATWCEACSREMDALNRLAERTAGRPDAMVVGVAVGEPAATVDAFVRNRGLGYVQLVDEEFRLADALGQRRVPATIVVDREGRIVHRGEALDAGCLEAFRRALGER
jgi:peroxiredoxin